jgi:hypothetical protein
MNIKVGDIFFTRRTLAGSGHGWIVLQITKTRKSGRDIDGEESYIHWKLLKVENPDYWNTLIGVWDNSSGCNWHENSFEEFGCIKLSKKDWEKQLIACVI